MGVQIHLAAAGVAAAALAALVALAALAAVAVAVAAVFISVFSFDCLSHLFPFYC